MTGSGLRLRRATRADTEAICALLHAVFPANPKADPAIYAWQYWDNPFGDPDVWVWEDGGRLVCHGALFPVPGVLAGEPVLLGHTGDSATLSSHQGQGLFTELARTRYAHAHERGMAAVLTLPNRSSLPGLRAAGMAPVGRVAAFVRPLRPAWLASRFRLPHTVARLAIRARFGPAPSGEGAARTAAPPEGLGELWERVTGPSSSGISRDDRWWQWRYGDSPLAGYRLAAVRRDGRLEGAIATAVHGVDGTPFLHVMDLLASDAEAAGSALGLALSDAADAVAAVALALPGGRDARVLRACGFRRLPRRLEPNPMTLGVAMAPRTQLPEPRSWILSWGDHDHR